MPDPAPARVGLRARKKRETRLALHRAALELSIEAGRQNLTADAIADRAGVSVRTFFNYFATKDAALTLADDEECALLREAVVGAPVDAGLAAALRSALHERLQALSEQTDLWRLRRHLAQVDPGYAAVATGSSKAWEIAILESAHERAGTDPVVDLDVSVLALATLGACRAAIGQHVRAGFAGELTDRLRLAFEALDRLGDERGAASLTPRAETVGGRA